MKLTLRKAEQNGEGFLVTLSAHVSPTLPETKTRPGLVSYVDQYTIPFSLLKFWIEFLSPAVESQSARLLGHYCLSATSSEQPFNQ